MNKSIIKQIITLQKTRFLNFYHVIYENKMGQEKNWFIASRKDEMQIKQQLLEDKKDKVDAVLLNVRHQDENKLVIIKQYRVPLNDYIYELPAGLIDEGEDLFEAAARELKEETGLTLVAIDTDKSHNQAYLSPGMTDESLGIVYGECKGEISTAFLEADEEIKPMLISKEEAKQIIASNEKIDIKALMALQHFILNNE